MSTSSSESFFTTGDADALACFSELTPIASRGYSELVRAKRYGRWWLLRGLKEAYRDDGIYQALLQKEYDILCQMQHPMVVAAFSFEEVAGLGRCIVMEWIEGQTLKEWLRQPHPRSECRRVADMLMEALDYVHRQQTEHRDLKPSNVMVTGSFIKLIDFGLIDTRSHAILKADCGTEGYRAPDGPSDIYSLGVILGELRLGVFSRPAIRRCLAPRERRWRNVSELRKALHRSWRWPRLAAFFFLTACLLAVVVAGSLHYNTRRTQRQMQTMEATLTDSLRSTRVTSKQTADSLQQRIAELETLKHEQELQEQQHQAMITRIQKSIDREARRSGIENLLDTVGTRMAVGIRLTRAEQRLQQHIEQQVRQLDPTDRFSVQAQMLEYLKTTYTDRWKQRYNALPLY